MRARDEVLAALPERRPYLRVQAGSEVYVLRVPSPHRVAELARAAGHQELSAAMAALDAVKGEVEPVVAFELVRRSGPRLVEMLGAVIGSAWSDPAWQLETPPPRSWDPENASAYGAAIVEELHEAGWPLDHVVRLGLALGAEIMSSMKIEREVQQQAAFFGRTTAAPSVAPSRSNSGPASRPEEGSTA